MSFYSWHKPAFDELVRRADRLPHALLIRGASGIGKRAFATALARGLLCEKPLSTLVACGHCVACHWFDEGSHPDFRLLQPEADQEVGEEESSETDKKKKKDISVAQIRQLPHFINSSSHRSGPKIIIIQPAEAMNVNAANALLKNLEEPPENTFFLLVTHRPQMLAATIRSRCQQIPLPMPTKEESLSWLEGVGVKNVAVALAQAGGAPLLAQEMDNEAHWALRAQFLQALSASPFDPLGLAEKMANESIAQLVGWLQRWTYDVSQVCFSIEPRYNPDFKEILNKLSTSVRGLEMLRFHRELVRFQRVINHPLNPRLLLESFFLRYAQLVRKKN